jgi:hypothetical protein
MDESLRRELVDSTRGLVSSGPDGLGLAALEEFGWAELLEDNPELAVATMFEEIGRASATSSALDLLVRATVPDLAARWPFTLCRLVSAPPTVVSTGDSVDVEGFVLGNVSTVTVVAAWHPTADAVPVLDVTGAKMVAVDGLDPSKQLQMVTMSGAAVLDICSGESADRFQAAIMRATAYEQLGAARAILDIACEHVRDRHQFGRPIGSYQAVQHRLAEVFVAAEAAAAALDASWDTHTDLAVPVAAALASDASTLAVRHGLQVCGGMGFTEEFSFAPQIKRAVLLADLFWSQRELRHVIGERASGVQPLVRLGNFDGD